MIVIVLNGEPKEIEAGKSVLDLVQSLNLPVERLAVEHNLKIVKRDQWPARSLAEGDKVEIVQLVGGGSVRIC